jgi:23S rRNA (pseudouridine1915-N3)-methyltransferase
MFKVKIYAFGKAREPWLVSALEEYEKRLAPRAKIEWIIAKEGVAAEAKMVHETVLIALDLRGEEVDSLEFSRRVSQWLQKGGSRIAFAIGGPEGLPSSVQAKACWRVSFSRLTFTNQMARLILLEQLYRALEIQSGSSYHK